MLFLHTAADLVPVNPTMFHSTADEVIDKRLDRIRRRHGETVIREFDVDPRMAPEKDKGKGRAHGVGRFVLSEGEEGETEDEDDFRPRTGRDAVGDYLNYISDYGYGYGHEQAEDVDGQPQVFGNPHFIGNAYESRRVVGIVDEDIEDEGSDSDALGDGGNKTPAAVFPPKSFQGTFEIEDEMVFEKPAAIFDDLDHDDDEYLYKQRRVPTNTSSVISHEPVSSDSDLALGRHVNVNRGFRSTPPPSSRENATSRKLIKHMPLLSGTTRNQSSEKFVATHSASSSSSSFITPPSSGFYDQGFQQAQNVGSVLSLKKLGRRWFKEKGGQKWEQRDCEEVIGSLV